MNKTELLAALATKYYLVKVYDKVGDAIRDMNIGFYVDLEGTGSEAAYWSPSEPKPVAGTGFQQEVMDYIKTKISAGAIEGAFITAIDQVKEIASGVAIVDVAGTLAEKKIFVDRSGGNLRHRVIG
jgi:hypothetical protein